MATVTPASAAHETTPELRAHMTTGWEPDLEVDDTLLRTFLYHQADLSTAVATAAGGESVWYDDLVVADVRRPSGYWSSAYLLAPPLDWGATMDRIEAFLAPGRGQAMLWSAWPTPDLAASELTAHGWVLSGHPPVLVRPPVSLVGVDEPGPRAVICERVADADGLREWERLVIEGYPLVDLAGEPPGSVAPVRLLDDPRFTFWTVRDADARAVSGGMSFESRGVASLALGATSSTARRGGHWRAHVTARLGSHPDRWFVGVFSDDSRPGAQRLGFVPITRLTLWILDRS